jgi:hypothetical protein
MKTSHSHPFSGELPKMDFDHAVAAIVPGRAGILEPNAIQEGERKPDVCNRGAQQPAPLVKPYNPNTSMSWDAHTKVGAGSPDDREALATTRR